MSFSFKIRMTFGKYRGLFVYELPDNYLEWLLTIELREPLKTAVLKEARYRSISSPASGSLAIVDTATARRIVEAGRRALARANHPDAGGDHDAMRRINTTADAMLEELRQ